MEMKQCAQGGHYYDASVYNECPYCKKANEAQPMPPNTGRTMPMAPPQGNDPTWNPGTGSRTVAIIKEDMGIDPVVGWLINIEGKEKGRDYRLHTDNNFIGRSERMDVCIGGDDTVSRENHASISYDARDKVFYCSPGDGRSIVRLNDKAVLATVRIYAKDILEIGKTKLMFVPLCGEAFEWA